MPIVAVCPYCREGKVRAPEKAIGLSATCPKCFNCFTVIASKDADAERPLSRSTVPAPKRTEPAPVVAPLSPTAIAVDQRTPEPMLATPIPVLDPPPRPPAPRPAPAKRAPVVVEEEPAEEPRTDGDSSFAMALVAITLAGLGVGLSQVPYGRFITVALAAVGLMVGGLALLIADRQRLWPAVGAGVNVAALVLVTLLPSWLGLDSWWPATVVDDSKQVKAVGFDPGKPIQPIGEGDWLDVSKGSWQRGDVRVTVTSVNLTPLQLKGPKEKQKVTKEKYILVGVQVRNSGVGRMFEYRTWNRKPATPEAPALKLTDSTGKELKLATFEEGWDFPGRGESGSLMPGKALDDLLVFEAPAGPAETLKLELPCEAFGEKAPPVRLLIPKAMIR